MVDYEKVITFLENTTLNGEERLHFKQVYQYLTETGEWKKSYEVLTSGWQKIDGVMLYTTEQEYDADYRVIVKATTERSLRELLLAFPRHSVGMFSISDGWLKNRLLELFQGECIQMKSEKYFVGTKKGSLPQAEQRAILKRKDEIAANLRKLTSLKGKLDNSQFIVEGEMLVARAFSDGLPIEKIFYTGEYITTSEGREFLKEVFDNNLSVYQTNDGIIGSMTTTRPIPTILASIHLNYPNFVNDNEYLNLHFSQDCLLLIIENVQNPDNLGMTLRTADAAGVSAVLISGEGANPFHKNCIRAARGAVGRLPIFYLSSTRTAIEKLSSHGWNIIGATASAPNNLYTNEYSSPIAIVVGNENSGLADETRKLCTELIRIPMASGQSSLNVGVAAGVLLYELRRCNMTTRSSV